MKVVVEADERRRKGMMPRSTVSGGSSGAPPKYHMASADHNSSRIGAITHNSNSGNSSSNSHNSSSSTVLLLHCRISLQSGHHNKLPTAASHATTSKRSDTSLASASCPSKATHHEPRHPWSINKGANRGVPHHRLAVLTTPSWMRFPGERKC
jgi:hypothetical protein